jgi:hypothetical protein
MPMMCVSAKFSVAHTIILYLLPPCRSQLEHATRLDKSQNMILYIKLQMNNARTTIPPGAAVSLHLSFMNPFCIFFFPTIKQEQSIRQEFLAKRITKMMERAILVTRHKTRTQLLYYNQMTDLEIIAGVI